MGLIKAISGAIGSTLGDQWKEYFYCEALPNDILAVKGKKKVSSRSSNTNGSDNVISSGSVICVADGQCMMIVEQGKVVELCAEPGEFTYDASTEPSIFSGKLGEGIKAVFAAIGKRFTFGGETPKDQRVYYFNTKELVGNKYGTAAPVPFRVVDQRVGMDMDIGITCFGEYSYKLVNPILFYTNVCGNVSSEYNREQLDSQLRSELLTALQPAFSKISEMGIRYSALPGHAMELADALREQLSAKWTEFRGIEIVNFGVSSVKANEEDEKYIRDQQRFGTAQGYAANMSAAQAQAMQDAAKNSGGAAIGFMGMNMAAQSTNFNPQAMYQMVSEQQAKAQEAAKSSGTWTCSCGTQASGNFCPNCGAKKPAEGWTCACGAVNKGKFCTECGAKKPADAPLYRCDKCGWEPEDPHHPPKFCPQCGDPFTEADIK